MEILFTDGIKNTLLRELETAADSIQIITAYCKLNAIEAINKHINKDVTHKRLLVRFKLEDILKGSTDFSIYDFCRNNNWDLYVNFNLHAKTYIIDNYRCIIGSANVSNRGLGFGSNGNYEIAAVGSISSDDIRKINNLFKDSLFITETIFDRLEFELNKTKDGLEVNSGEIKDWSDSIISLARKTVNVLFSYELPEIYSPYECLGSYSNFMDSFIGYDSTLLRDCFVQSNCFSWLVNCLEKNGGEMFFGELTRELHAALINDPKPYRRDVKIMLSNLLNWVKELEIGDIHIDIPRHSQRIYLIGSGYDKMQIN